MATSFIQSSSRPLLSSSLPLSPSQIFLQTRTVLHHARPARRPHFPSPLTPPSTKPTPGTSRPNPTASTSQQQQPNPSTVLADSGLIFHHAPPPSFPNYKTGLVPDVLKWVGGSEGVRMSGQRVGPYVRQRRGTVVEDGDRQGLDLGEDVVEEIRRLRAEDPVKWTRSALSKKYSLQPHQASLLARLAPATKSHRLSLQEDLSKQKETWGFNKRIAREAREVRKGFW